MLVSLFYMALLRPLTMISTVVLMICLLTPSRADACGCFSSPQLPTPDQYAVNQQGEQIIFEVDEDASTVAAHVLIQYAGAPESFAWILPVPSVPTLGLGEQLSFALLDAMTAPALSQNTVDVCPGPWYRCRYHDPCPILASGDAGMSFDASAADAAPPPFDAGGPGTPVIVLGREVIGDYDTVSFAAGDAAAAIAWLNSEGFIVNDTMSPFMQPYADAGMVFVAAKLVPTAEVDTLRPLTLTYDGIRPMIPLRLTAVGAEPELTVTTYLFGDTDYAPVDQPVVEISESLTTDLSERSNYPMLLSRTIDEAGGAAFVAEYRGAAPTRDQVIAGPSGTSDACCTAGDPCNVAEDATCQCPSEAWDAMDCGEGAVRAVDILGGLAERNARVTRLITRLSSHEMTFDPMFAPRPSVDLRLSMRGSRVSLDACSGDAVEPEVFAETEAMLACATTYCGSGVCVITDRVAGCVCDPGFAARMFTDLDGGRSITCVPEESPVDLSAGGIALQSSCDGADCGLGRCVDQGGFPACVCDEGSGATLGVEGPECVSIRFRTDDAGGLDRSARLRDVRMCMPHPPSCRPGGWLQRVVPAIGAEECGRAAPASRLEVPPAPICPSLDAGGDASVGDAGRDAGDTHSSGPCAVGFGGRGNTNRGSAASVFLIAFALWRRRLS